MSTERCSVELSEALAILQEMKILLKDIKSDWHEYKKEYYNERTRKHLSES
jgi:hypothetical protein